MRDKCVEMSENANKMRDRLIEILHKMPKEMMIGEAADYLLANGVFVAPMPMTDWLREELTEHINKRCFEEL